MHVVKPRKNGVQFAGFEPRCAKVQRTARCSAHRELVSSIRERGLSHIARSVRHTANAFIKLRVARRPPKD